MMIHTRPEMLHTSREMNHTHRTAPTQFVEANGIRFAYRRFGKPDGVPLVFNQHFTGTMDHWDPVTDGLAMDREVVLFNNAGVRDALLLGHGNEITEMPQLHGCPYLWSMTLN